MYNASVGPARSVGSRGPWLLLQALKWVTIVRGGEQRPRAFAFWSRFCGCVTGYRMAGMPLGLAQESDDAVHGKSVRSGPHTTTKPIPDPQSGLAVGCFWIGRLRKRVCRLWPELTGPNPEASLGPEWAALKKHKEERLSTRLSSDPFFFLSFGLSSLDGWTPLKGVWGFVGSVSFFFQ